MASQTAARPARRDESEPRAEQHSSKGWWTWGLGAVLVAAAAVGAYWWTHREQSSDKSEQAKSSRSKGDREDKAATRVKVVYPHKGGITRTTVQPGVVHAYEHARLFAKAPGYLRAQVVDIGDTVERGQFLAEIYDPERQQAVQQAAAEVEQAKAAVQQAEALVTVAEAEVRVSTAEVKEKKAQVAQYVALRARANLGVAEARQTAATILAEYTQLISPYTGIITERNYHRGDFIRSATKGGGLRVEILSGLHDDQILVSYSGSIEDGVEVEAEPATIAEAKRGRHES